MGSDRGVKQLLSELSARGITIHESGFGQQ
jgi:hypothetical protein